MIREEHQGLADIDIEASGFIIEPGSQKRVTNDSRFLRKSYWRASKSLSHTAPSIQYRSVNKGQLNHFSASPATLPRVCRANMLPCFHRALVLGRSVGRSCGHPTPVHSDAAAVPREVFTQAGSSGYGRSSA